MRRAVMAVIIGGYAFWGIGSGLGHQPVIVGARLAVAVKPVKPAKPALQTVTFGGYTVSIPASWPVYDLTKNPRQCVRYDVHAVYLGTPGPDPDCPPNLVGRVDTVSIQAPAASAGTKTAGNTKGPRRGGQQALNPGTIVQDPDRHELALVMPDKAPQTPGRILAGFDTCAAPSLPTMKAWRARYAAAAIYIGGQMMAYDHTNAGCRTAVLTFPDAWTRQLKAVGYISGVYSSAGSAITDLQSSTTVAGHSLAEPQAIWFALWDNGNSMTGAPYMTSAVWPVASRSKQYAGNRMVKVGGISLNIDADWVASAVARK
jgi:hypothetical protein